MIKLIATDLDGTLFYPKRKIKLVASRNTKFLREFVSSGRNVVLVSGRNISVAKNISKKVHASVDMIGCNGAVVYQGGKVIAESPMDHEMVKKFYEDNKSDSKVFSWCFMTSKHNLIIVPNMNPVVTFLYRIGMLFQFRFLGKYYIGKKYYEQMINDPEEKIYKTMALYGLGSEAVETARKESLKMNDAYGTDLTVLWSSQSVEYMNKNINKANALKNLLNVLKLNADDVAVVGDSGNDVPLFEEFPNSFVMKQAPDEVKSKARVVIEGVYSLKDYTN